MSLEDARRHRMSDTTVWQSWVRQPQRVWLRRAIFQVHLWTGLAIGLYLVVLSLSGSVLVYHEELDRLFATPHPLYEPNRTRLSTEELRTAALRVYPQWQVTYVSERLPRRRPVIEVWLERGEQRRERLLNPYTGADLGPAMTTGERMLGWLSRLHDDLLLNWEGRWWNGFGSAIFTLLVVAGAIVWWPGLARWKRSLTVSGANGWRRFIWELHGAAGIWLLLFMLMWGISGWYLGIPGPLSSLVDAISDPEAFLGQRPGDRVLAWLTRLHFGRWDNEWLKALWAFLGLVPALMFVTGAIMWWNRVVRAAKR